jgi:hypothetical protein
MVEKVAMGPPFLAELHISPYNCHPPSSLDLSSSAGTIDPSVAAVRRNSDRNPAATNEELLINKSASTLKMEIADPSETFRLHGAITTKTLISIFTTANPKYPVTVHF